MPRYRNFTTHPACGKRYPANDTVGHCSGCCRNFAGITSFDHHQLSPSSWSNDTERTICLNPEEDDRYGWWVDELDIWHSQPKMTAAQKQKLYSAPKAKTDAKS